MLNYSNASCKLVNYRGLILLINYNILFARSQYENKIMLKEENNAFTIPPKIKQEYEDFKLSAETASFRVFEAKLRREFLLQICRHLRRMCRIMPVVPERLLIADDLKNKLFLFLPNHRSPQPKLRTRTAGQAPIVIEAGAGCLRVEPLGWEKE